MNNMDGTERDGLDEVILPIDCQVNPIYPDEHHRNHWFESSRILDDELNAWFLPTLPSGCLLTVLIDACHSGTAFDLKYTYSCKPRCPILPECDLECQSPVTDFFSSSPLFSVAERSIPGPTRDCHPEGNNFPGHSVRVRESSGVNKRRRSLTIRRETDDPLQSYQEGPVVVHWASCTDAESAYGSKKGGLMVNMFIEYLCDVRGKLPTHRELLFYLHRRLREKFCQIETKFPSLIELQEPQLGTNMKPVIDQPVVL